MPRPEIRGRVSGVGPGMRAGFTAWRIVGQCPGIPSRPFGTLLMGLSEHIQKSLFPSLPSLDPGRLRDEVMRKGWEWLAEHPADLDRIRDNLRAFSLPSGEQDVRAVAEHVLLHYTEKLMPLCGSVGEYRRFVDESIAGDELLKTVDLSRENSRALLLASAHFGAVEMIVPFLSSRGVDVTPVLRFSTPEFSRIARGRAEEMAAHGDFRPIRFIEIGKPGTVAAMEMAAVLRRGNVLVSMFDERTGYSTPVDLAGRKVWGGAGLERLLHFAGASTTVATVFAVRREDGTCRLRCRVPKGEGTELLRQMYDNLEELVRGHFEQWYFLHEDIPFVEREGNGAGQQEKAEAAR